jgi:hypothetical protein
VPEWEQASADRGGLVGIDDLVGIDEPLLEISIGEGLRRRPG